MIRLLALLLLVPPLQDPLPAPAENPAAAPVAPSVPPAALTPESPVPPAETAPAAPAAPAPADVAPPEEPPPQDPGGSDALPALDGASEVPAEPPAVVPFTRPAASNPHALVKDEGEPLAADSRRELAVRGVLGVVAGLVPWAPLGGLCCASAALMALVYPVTLGNPAGDSGGCYGAFCGTGVVVGMAAWFLGLVLAPLAAAVSGAGLLLGVLLPGISSVWQRVPVRRAAFLGAGVALAAFPLTALGVAVSGVLPWAVSVGWLFFSGLLPRNPTWLYARWAMLNAAFMAAVVVGVGVFLVSPLLPPVLGMGAFVTGLQVLPAE